MSMNNYDVAVRLAENKMLSQGYEICPCPCGCGNFYDPYNESMCYSCKRNCPQPVCDFCDGELSSEGLCKDMGKCTKCGELHLLINREWLPIEWIQLTEGI